jgi:hypothetical protein
MKHNFFSGKKGGVGVHEALEMIPYILLTVLVMAGVFFLMNMFTNLSIEIKPVQREVFFYRTLYAPHSIMFTDEKTGVVYPGVIDMNKFNTSVLDESARYVYDRQIAAKLTLFDLEMKEIKTIYYNENWFERLYPLAKARLIGKSSASLSLKLVPVIFKDGDVQRDGWLRVEIIIPN